MHARLKNGSAAEIADVLRAELADGRYRVGERLPDVDALRARFGAGEFAVRHALQMLRDRGFITLKPHIGAVAADSLAHAWKGHVALVHTSRASNYFVSRLSVVLGERLESAGWCYHPVFTAAARDGSIDTSSIERHVANGLDFAIVYSEFRQIARLFDRAGVPYIVLNGFTRDFPTARGVFREDFKPAFRELIEALRTRGARTMLEVDLTHRMEREFKLLLHDAGVNVTRIMCEIENESPHTLRDVRELGYRAIATFLADARNRARLPDVILFDDDYLASGGIAAMLEAGLKIPDDIRMVSFAIRGDEPVFGASMARIELDPDTYGAAVADYVLKLLADKRAAPPRIAWRFIPGNSL